MSAHSTDSSPVILVVEENEGVRNLLETALPILGFRTLVVANGETALQTYREHLPEIDLVLMDVNMDGLSGSQTLNEMQQMDAQVRCCFMSGDTSAERWPELLGQGALCIIDKPFSSLQELAHTLRHHVRQAK